MSQSKINVTVVDDDESFARSLERLFRASGFEVHTYGSAEAFLSSTPFLPPDCLVLDVLLGGISGLDLQRQLHAAGYTAPVIFVTAYDAPGIREAVQQAGCSTYFLKPVGHKSLIDAVTAAVSHKTEPCFKKNG